VIVEKITNYIDGKLIGPKKNKYLKNLSPVNGKVYSLIPDSDANDVRLAVKAAKKAFLHWGKSTREYRCRWMLKLAEAIDNHAENLVASESFDNGKPEWLAKTIDIPRCSANLRFFATAITHFDSKSHDMDGAALNYTLKKPIGVAGCISPWNLPLYLLTWKIAPAIAAGNTVVAKPSEITPYTAHLLSKICVEINFPKGVINIVHGKGKTAGEAVVKQCDVISFTGGTETGKTIAEKTARQFKKCSLELGGKNPMVVFKDCDFNLTVDTVVRGAFLNQGQICLCGSRVFIEKDIYASFRSALVNKIKQLSVGDPKNPKNNLGAVVSKEHLKSILLKIKTAQDSGGKVLVGGDRIVLSGPLKNGYYMSPCLIEKTKNTDKINQEEVFGPVATIMPFSKESEVIKLCNETKYGLSACVFSNNISKAHRVAAKIDAGLVWINSWLIRDLRIPFGGMKDSGLGREGGYNSLNFFTEQKNVCVKIDSGENK
jgi:aminomuconate-semialdehyde/2-hydroxymuconate-6-semialdehyde dehydrogenase